VATIQTQGAEEEGAIADKQTNEEHSPISSIDTADHCDSVLLRDGLVCYADDVPPLGTLPLALPANLKTTRPVYQHLRKIPSISVPKRALLHQALSPPLLKKNVVSPPKIKKPTRSTGDASSRRRSARPTHVLTLSRFQAVTGSSVTIGIVMTRSGCMSEL